MCRFITQKDNKYRPSRFLVRYRRRKRPFRTQGTVGFVKFDIKDINSTACVDPEKGIREVAQVAMMGFREVLIAGGYVNKVQHRSDVLLLVGGFRPIC